MKSAVDGLNADGIYKIRVELEQAQKMVDDLSRENQKLKNEAEKVHQYQSAYQSNSNAFQEKMESLI